MSRIRIKKTNRRKIQREMITKSQQGPVGAKALDLLDVYINNESPKLIKLLAGRFSGLKDAVSYEDLRDALLSGELDESMLEEWRQEYSKIITDVILPTWRKAMDQAAINQDDLKDFKWDNYNDRVKLFTQQRTADLVTSVTEQQKDAIKALTERVTTGELTADELARVIRPTVGLNASQSRANVRYYETMRNKLEQTMEKDVAEKKAREAALKYSEKQSRYRAKMIAETEIAMAYKTGVQESMHQAMDQGVVDLRTKTWITAGNELVCPECGALNGITIKIDDDFHIGGNITHHDGYCTIEGGRVAEADGHAHPNCKCACIYN